jgi:hypothetical protein
VVVVVVVDDGADGGGVVVVVAASVAVVVVPVRAVCDSCSSVTATVDAVTGVEVGRSVATLPPARVGAAHEAAAIARATAMHPQPTTTGRMMLIILAPSACP